MPLTVNIQDHWSDGNRIHVVGTITPSGNYPTGGDTLNFGLTTIKSTKPPVWCAVEGDTNLLYACIPGSTISNGKLKIIVSNTGLEQAAGAYPASILTDGITFQAIFHKFR
jgi:hypothetical protein